MVCFRNPRNYLALYGDPGMLVLDPQVLPQNCLLQTFLTASSRLFPAAGGSVIAHFLCGIFQQNANECHREGDKGLPGGDKCPRCWLSLLPYAVPVHVGPAATLWGLWGLFICAQKWRK